MNEPEPSPSDWRQVLWTAAGWVALVVGLVIVLMVFKPGGC